MTTILIVRHGQSVSNNLATMTGQKDSPLSEYGLKQAEIVSEHLFKNYKISAIYSSDLTRAVQTLNPLSRFSGLEIRKISDLREMNMGVWQGKKISDLNEDSLFVKWRDYDSTIKIPGGESFLELQERVYKAIQKIAIENSGRTVAVVTHGGAIRMLLAKILNVQPENWKEKLKYVTNASITRIEYENGEFQFVNTNDGYLNEYTSEMPKGI
ncbi:MAG: histidine phosphatase family protein [Clostridia bacterium]|nr:histidine phosphatase family protein [Clostridia bacterium]